jgi:hypothetical protein
MPNSELFHSSVSCLPNSCATGSMNCLVELRANAYSDAKLVKYVISNGIEPPIWLSEKSLIYIYKKYEVRIFFFFVQAKTHKLNRYVNNPISGEIVPDTAFPRPLTALFRRICIRFELANAVVVLRLFFFFFFFLVNHTAW